MKKRPLTLLEVMIVILLITLITGVIGYNMKGSLDKGKIFRTQRAIEQLHDLLYLRQTETGKPLKAIVADAKNQLKETGLLKNVDDFLKDGWGEEIQISVNGKNELVISSARLEKYQAEHTSKN